ncbi:MAG: hypothetical protein HY879_19480, partial [Deltaproteobacteria bacterium]|nr:hypothetical protein [Deltaproteobacteria bacterium]
MKERSRFVLLGILFLCLMFIGMFDRESNAAWAGDWRQMGLSQFPARLNAITFPSGHRLDSNNSFKWGAWDVSFGGKNPIATGNNYQNTLGSINIDLTCANAIIGTRTCKMLLWLPKMRTNTPCFIDV